MKTNQKGFVNITLIILAVAVVGVVGYFVLVKKPTSTALPSPTSTSTQGSAAQQQTQTQSSGETSDWQTYSNSKYGFELKYPANAIFSDEKDSYVKKRVIAFNIPFEKNYDKFTDKVFFVVIYEGSCGQLTETGTVNITDKKIINGTEFYYEDPVFTDTSGMSSISKLKYYLVDLNSQCFQFEESIKGTGNNETSPNATSPSDFDAYFSSEMKVLDEMMKTVKFIK